jgi:flagellar hook protein FlgE
MDISAIALQGLEQSQVQLDNAASRLAGAGASADGLNSDSVDLSAGMVALLSAKNNFAVNISIMKTADQIEKYTIDLMA